jgi:hypothetical protein
VARPEHQRLFDEVCNGFTRLQLLRNVIEFKEFKKRSFNANFVLVQYFGFLRCDPRYARYEYWLNRLNRGPNAKMVKAFINSDEYGCRFSP